MLRPHVFAVAISLVVAAAGTAPAQKGHDTGPVRVQDEPRGTALEQGLWWLYHLKYEQARALFEQYVAANPRDPAGYFYKTAADWWQLAQQFDRELPEIRERLENDYQDTVRVAEALLKSSDDDKEKAQACLYMGGAQGLKGRWLVTQGQWFKAYFLGKSGHKMLKRALKYDPELYDAYLGLGIYDYYTDTLEGAKKVLAALLIGGDRERGLKQLHVAIEKGTHARVEAMMFLIEIYTWQEKTPAKALPIAQRLRAEFPKSPAMHLAEIIEYYELRQWDQLRAEAQVFYDRSRQGVPYFAYEGVHPARYCLGVAALWGEKNPKQTISYMEQILKEDEPNSRWVTFAYLRMGQAYDLLKNRDKAVEYYKKVLNRPNFWGSHFEAARYAKEAFTYSSNDKKSQ